jgi:CRISPR-associated protein Cmr6
MTPHYAGWIPEAPPGDWREPMPVPFLVVAPGTSFLFSLLPRGIERGELETVFQWLRDALHYAGAGAKTAVGYGRFAYDEQQTTARAETMEKARAARALAARRAALQGTAEGRWLDALEGKPESTILELVRVHLEAQPMADAAERRGFARAVAETPYVALWRKGETQDKTIRTGRDKLRARAKSVDTAASEPDPESTP